MRVASRVFQIPLDFCGTPLPLWSRAKTEFANKSSLIYIYIYISASIPAGNWPRAAPAGNFCFSSLQFKSPPGLYLLFLFFSLLPLYLISYKPKFMSSVLATVDVSNVVSMLHLSTANISTIPSTVPVYQRYSAPIQ